MKTVIFLFILIFGMTSLSSFEESPILISKVFADKIDIKIKNDTGDAIKVINAGIGGSYSLAKGTTTTLKMEVGDKLHHYESGKKGALILVATKEMNGKVQLLSKL